jgi:hypothetical protein
VLWSKKHGAVVVVFVMAVVDVGRGREAHEVLVAAEDATV